MADKTYLVKSSSVTGAMEALATNVEESKVLKVDDADVTAFEALLPSDEELWMSGETASNTYAEGFQTRGVTLPKKVVNG